MAEDLFDEIANDDTKISFLVQVWKDEPSAEGDQEIWRGHITAIRDDGTRHYFTNFDDIPALMLDYLKQSK